MSWKLSAVAPRESIESALDAAEGRDDGMVLTAFEVDPADGEIWQLDAYCEGKPGKAERAAILALFAGTAPDLLAEELPETDWVTESQRGVEPIRAGRFHVHTPDHPASDERGITSFCIPAAQAFGTGHHETTAGCLTMLTAMHAAGLRPRHVADIGTGTGLLAFAAMDLWPRAVVTASDNDPVCEPAVLENARFNGVALGKGPGELTMLIAEGMDAPLLEAAAPFDLLIANILAMPLIEMARDFAEGVAPRGSILLSGLLTRQEDAVKNAYRRAGFRLQSRLVSGDWSILWLRHRYRG
ncbi:50S ribosomal protein L11 methyltransferase [Erythrobacter arachoides]|uniref:Ribosomal protein L11 methyltransferase n=1 Tax=Aurantiacibacter arachoides TaxID=1850444 RepID=A0A845A1H6_9SPHN|nr:50S ribosomal protein L11 methyltransferase [Aurantiacibacter arachoides]MXO93420.1 50S ribosomal protein L11 methyltransferase [Aurantiacibacter arachoides]GGD49524.1 ribosomal protein L11 methyltransferase [Aurantiacibacter arachoides]